MDDGQHQQVMEDLATDFLCYRSSFDLTTDSPLRRRRQCPPHLASRVKEVERSTSAPIARDREDERVLDMLGMTERHFQATRPLHIKRTVISRRHSSRLACSTPSPTSAGSSHLSCPSRAAGGKRMMDLISKGSSPQGSKGGSPKHDSLRSPVARKFLWTQESHPVSPPAHAPLHRRVCAECTARAHSDGKVHQAEADTSEHASSTLQRSHSEPLSEPLKPLLQWAKRPVAPVELQRANSLDVEAGHRRAPKMKAVAHALIATFSMSAPRDLLRGDAVVTSEDVTMLAWEHAERIAIGRRRSESVGAHDAVAPPPPVQRQAARKLLCAPSSDALLRGSTSRALSLIREKGFDLTSGAGV